MKIEFDEARRDFLQTIGIGLVFMTNPVLFTPSCAQSTFEPQLTEEDAARVLQ